jgi:RNA polymerase sigma factor (sigma-70 family)
MGGTQAASSGRGQPPRTPRTRVGVLPPTRARRDRRRPTTPRHRLPSLTWSAVTPSVPLLIAAEATLIDDWRHARRVGDAGRAAELSQFLWTANQSLVERAARHAKDLPREESRQIAAVALFRAFEHFDGSRGVPFAGYAAYWFRKERQTGRASAAFGTALPAHRIASLTRGETRADAVLRGMAHPTTLDADAPVAAVDAGPEDAVLDALTAATVRQHVARLAPLTRRIVELRFGFDGSDARSNRAVAALLGLSEFTVRTHLSRGLRVLRARVASIEEPDAGSP